MNKKEQITKLLKNFAEAADIMMPSPGTLDYYATAIDNLYRDEWVTHLRRDGNTTRQIDAAVQELFKSGSVIWLDHAHSEYPLSRTPKNRANIHGFMILLDRLYREHHLENGHGIIIDKKNWKIKLSEPPKQ